MTVNGLDAAQPHVLGWRFVLAVPQEADDVRKPHVAALERDEHLVLNLGHEECPAPLAAHRRGHADPIGFVLLFVGVEMHLDATRYLLVDFGDEAGYDAVDRGHSFSIRAVKSVV